MARFGLCGASYQSESPTQDAEYTLGWYPEAAEAGGRSQLGMFPTPGLSLFANLPPVQVPTSTVYAVPAVVQKAQVSSTIVSSNTISAIISLANDTVMGNLLILVVRGSLVSASVNNLEGANSPTTTGFSWGSEVVSLYDKATGPHTAGIVAVFFISNASVMAAGTQTSFFITTATGGISSGALDLELYEVSGINQTATGFEVLDAYTGNDVVGAGQVPQVLSGPVAVGSNDFLLMATQNYDSNSTVGTDYTLLESGANAKGATQALVQANPGVITDLSFGGSNQTAYAAVLLVFKAQVIGQNFQAFPVISTIGLISWNNRVFAVGNLGLINNLPAWQLYEVFADGTVTPSTPGPPGTGKQNGWGYFVPGQGGMLPQALASMAIMPGNPGQLVVATGGSLYCASLDHSFLNPVTTSPGNIYQQLEYVDGFIVSTLGNSAGPYVMTSISRKANLVTAVVSNPTGKSVVPLTVGEIVNVQGVGINNEIPPAAPTSGTQAGLGLGAGDLAQFQWDTPANLTTLGLPVNVVMGPSFGGGADGISNISYTLMATNYGYSVGGGIPVTSVTFQLNLQCDTQGLFLFPVLVRGGTIINSTENGAFTTQKGSQSLSVTFTTLDGVNPITPAALNDTTFGIGFIATGSPAFHSGIATVTISSVVISDVEVGTETDFNGPFPLTSVVPGAGSPPLSITVTWIQVGEDNSDTTPGTLGSITSQGSNQFQISNLFDASTWLPINQSGISLMQDEVISFVVSQRLLWFLGRKRTIPYYNTGQLFPFSALPGVFVEKGSGATFATVRLDNSIFWIEADERGWATAQRGTGYTPTRISNHGVENEWNKLPNGVSDFIGWTYAEEGHSFWILYSPSAGKTWAYDVNTALWCHRAYLNQTTGVLEAHLGQCHAFAFGKNLVADRKSGNIYWMSINNLNDNGARIVRIRRSPAIAKEHEWLKHDKLEVLLESGLLSNLVGPAPYPVTITLPDAVGNPWWVQVLNNGTVFTEAAPPGTPTQLVYLNDGQTNTTCWQLVYQGGHVVPVAVPYRTPSLAQMVKLATTSNIQGSPSNLQASGLYVTNSGTLQVVVPHDYQVEPKLSRRFSDDGGHTWSNYLTRGAGLTGQYKKRLTWYRQGRSRNRIYEISTSDDYPWRIIDGYVKAGPGDVFAPTERLSDVYRKLG